jgi:hypothetical protein
MSLIPDGSRIGESRMSTFNVFTPAPHYNQGIDSRYGIGGSAIVSKALPDFGLLGLLQPLCRQRRQGQGRSHRGCENPPDYAASESTCVLRTSRDNGSISDHLIPLSFEN